MAEASYIQPEPESRVLVVVPPKVSGIGLTNTKSSLGEPKTTSSKGDEAELHTPKTILRLKRRLDDSPTKILVMSYKRRKQDTDNTDVAASENLPGADPDDIRAVFCFAGTTSKDEVNESVAQSILVAYNNVRQTEKEHHSVTAREQFKTRKMRALQKSSETSATNSKEDRFKVLSSKRGIQNNDVEDPSETPLLFHLLDLVADYEDIPSKIAKVDNHLAHREVGSVTMNGVPMIKKDQPSSSKTSAGPEKMESDFVYDIYVAREGMQAVLDHEQYVSVHRADDYEFDWYREEDSGSENGGMNDEEDSNDEDNWRNDYPDSDPDRESDENEGYAHGYDGENDFADGLSNVHIGGHDLSSDDDGGYIYSTENDGADEGLGSLYRSYKAFLRKQEISDEVVSSASDSD